MKKIFVAVKTVHLTNRYLIEIEGKDEQQMRETVVDDAILGVALPYQTLSAGSDDCHVTLQEVDEGQAQIIEH